MPLHLVKHIRRFFYGKMKIALLVSSFAILSSVGLYFISKSIQRTPKIQNFSQCSLCPKLQTYYGNSSPEDLVLIGAFGDVSKSFPFIRSLRSVGCKARIVLVNNETTDQYTLKQLESCGVEYFKMKSPKNSSSFYPHSLRYIGYSQYIKSANMKYKRVLHADAFDVFFQSDPFTKNIEQNRLYFIMEDILIGNSTWNSGWLKRAYNESISKQLENFTVSCSGTIIGGYSQFQIYLNTLLGHAPFWANGRHSLDQAYHNYLLHTGKFADNGVNVSTFGCNSPFLTMHYCSRDKNSIRGGEVVCPDQYTVPSVVHQYNLFPQVGKLLLKKCKT